MASVTQRMQEFIPGTPDGGMGARTVYQFLEGRVFTLTKTKDGGTSRGEVGVGVLRDLIGREPAEGWYDASGDFLGEEPPRL